MKRVKIFIFLLFPMLILSGSAFAQSTGGCIDSFYVRPGYPCNHDYQPVCGCDGVTYENSCVATYQHGVTYFTDGICEPIAIHFVPNPVTYYYNFNVTIMLHNPGNANIYVFNWMGTLMYENTYYNIQRYDFQLDVSGYKTGVYIIIAESNGNTVVKKFVKT